MRDKTPLRPVCALGTSPQGEAYLPDKLKFAQQERYRAVKGSGETQRTGHELPVGAFLQTGICEQSNNFPEMHLHFSAGVV